MSTPSSLAFYNTYTKRREIFVPRSSQTVRLFTCGPSVYRRQHLGNYRTFLFEDILQRYLEYRGYPVERAINFTDVEDKAVEEAKAEGTTLGELTQPVIDEFLDSATRLGIRLPEGEIPRATTSVEQAVEIIETLVERGHAYRHGGNIYYDPLTFPGFGQIFGLDMSKWPNKRYRFSRDTYEGLRWNRGDFILWHARSEDDPFSWDTRLGRGRPAWNVQDPAMIAKTLGYEIDIHCGGIDNVYRHHDYNRAVMEGISGREFCHYWLHGEHLIHNGEKMSKSRGNVVYPSNLFDQTYSPQHVRFTLTYGHYRSKLNMTDALLRNTGDFLDRMRRTVHAVTEPAAPRSNSQPKAGKPDAAPTGHESPSPRAEAESRRTDRIIEEIPQLFQLQMDNDLNVKGAFDDLYNALEDVRRRGSLHGRSSEQAKRIRRYLSDIDTVLGVLFR